MPRPRNFRKVWRMPGCNYFKPVGVPMNVLEHVELSIDEFEAVRLTCLEGMYQADAAEKMNVSRQTLGRILETAHRKIADALVNGKALKIEGGNVEFMKESGFGKGRGGGFGCRGRRRGRGFSGGRGPQQ